MRCEAKAEKQARRFQFRAALPNFSILAVQPIAFLTVYGTFLEKNETRKTATWINQRLTIKN
jgi:hypothetical protein